MTEVKLSNQQVENLLYYETGFEQMHPHLGAIEWMEEYGWKYRDDWNCVKVAPDGQIRNARIYYKLTFADDEMASMFLLKWL